MGDLSDRVWIEPPGAGEATVLKLRQSSFLTGPQGSTSRTDLADFRQNPLGKIQTEFKKPADECKTHAGEEPSGREALLTDVCMEGHDTQLSRTVDSAIDEPCG